MDKSFKTGDKIGSLSIVGELSKYRGYILYDCICDCGNRCSRTSTQLKRPSNPNCRGDTHLVGTWYPPTPIPYPDDAAKVLERYIHLAQRFQDLLNYQNFAVERLMRHCWIVAYRQRIGDPVPDEKNYIKKCLRLKYNQSKKPRVKFNLKHELGGEATMKESSDFYQDPITGETVKRIVTKKRFRRC